jgi:formate dehydrogenase alpha subunit
MTTTIDQQTIQLTIDGKSVAGKPGESVLQMARRNRIHIPTLCNHADLEPYGGCRMCLVEVKSIRGLTTSCTTQIAPGMEVKTFSPEIDRARRVSLELLLADHPLECLTCAKNQQCELQALAAEFGIDRIRFRKTREFRPLDESNPFFAYDPNKCVLCARCVRTCRQLQGLGAIDLVNRGVRTVVGAANGVPWVDSVCESCGECVSRCPSGALADKQRKQPLAKIKTTCTFCGTGCGLFLGVRGNEIVSVSGDRTNPVNQGRLCVKGRYGNSFVNSPKRLTTPLIKHNGKFEEATWDEALDLIASKFKQYQGSQIAVQGSSRCSNEENYLVQKLARAVFHTNNVDNCARLCHAPTVAGLVQSFGTGGGTNPISDLNDTKCIFVIGSNTTEAHPVVGSLVRRIADRGTPLIVADPRKIDMTKHADLWLPLKPGTDVPLLMGIARVIIEEGLHDPEFVATRCDDFEVFKKAAEPFDLDTVESITGVPKEQIVKAARLYGGTRPAVLIYSLGITEHSHGVDNVMAVANLALLTGNVGKPSAGVMPMRGQNNVQGACDMGCIPNAFQGYQYVSKPEVREKFAKAWGAPMPELPGISLVDQFTATLDGKIKAFYIVGIDPAYSIADSNKVWKALRKAEFVVFQDIFLTGSAEFADVVLPGASFAEKDGTFTNLERRVQLIRKAIEPIGDSRPDWWITCQIGRRMGAQGFDFDGAAAIMDEIAELTPSFAGISFARLEHGGIQWPCTGKDHPGTPRLHVEKFNTATGLGHLAPLEYRPSAEGPDENYPFLLTTGRSLYHFHLAMTIRVDGLMKLYPEETVRINPADAERMGIENGELVKVTSRRGALCVKAWVTEETNPGQAFMTFHFYRQPTNVLTNQALDPVSKTPEFKVTAIRIDKVTAEEAAEIEAVLEDARNGLRV